MKSKICAEWPSKHLHFTYKRVSANLRLPQSLCLTLMGRLTLLLCSPWGPSEIDFSRSRVYTCSSRQISTWASQPEAGPPVWAGWLPHQHHPWVCGHTQQGVKMQTLQSQTVPSLNKNPNRTLGPRLSTSVGWVLLLCTGFLVNSFESKMWL